jgi:hypothetical protein
MPAVGESVATEIYNVCFKEYCFDCEAEEGATENSGTCENSNTTISNLSNCLACNLNNGYKEVEGIVYKLCD